MAAVQCLADAKMKLLLFTILLLILNVYAAMPHRAEICGNTIVHTRNVPKAVQWVRDDGCPEPVVLQIEEEHYLVYGVKITLGY